MFCVSCGIGSSHGGLQSASALLGRSCQSVLTGYQQRVPGRGLGLNEKPRGKSRFLQANDLLPADIPAAWSPLSSADVVPSLDFTREGRQQLFCHPISVQGGGRDAETLGPLGNRRIINRL